jgi:hypothetical protein
MGRTYHLIATGCKDTFVRIYKVKLSGTKYNERLTHLHVHRLTHLHAMT